MQSVKGGKPAPSQAGNKQLPPRIQDKLESANIVERSVKLILENVGVCIEEFIALKTQKVVVKDQIDQINDR